MMTAQEFLEFWQSTGLTQKELANVLGCSQSAISEWKDGKRTIPKKTLTIIRFMQENQQLKEKLGMSNNAHEADSNPPPQIWNNHKKCTTAGFARYACRSPSIKGKI